MHVNNFDISDVFVYNCYGLRGAVMPTTKPIPTPIIKSARNAKNASRKLAALPLAGRNDALLSMADALQRNSGAIFDANAKDLAAASSLPEPIIKRLRYDEHKLLESVNELQSLAALPDPLNRTLMSTTLADSLDLYRVTCPLGVIGMIFESRPDALVQIAALCLKTGNAVLLKGGSEARHTNRALFEAITGIGGIPSGWAALLESREDVAAMLGLDEYISLLIPRGSGQFVRYIMDNTRIPVLGHAEGLCHVYVDESADIEMAARIVRDSKLQYPAVCNAAETLLVHQAIAEQAIPSIRAAMPECEFRDDGFDTEYLDRIISVRVVPNLDEAIAHINRYGSGHTDAIVTTSKTNASRFMNEVDSADVFWNCSTRFSDGYRFGLGAEVGVSTSKIHARGPVGMEGLTTYKYKLIGGGHTVGEFADGLRQYTHNRTDSDCPV
ncbi:gamma-glutamyl phosphate reductase [Clostridia bacterium]|nr:gamma-glutamyl phosphate reductase [Clostridia bacterium]